MQMTCEKVGGVTVVLPQVAYLDASNAQEFKTASDGMVAPKAHVVLDMSQVGFVDSAGLGAILSFFRKLNAEQGELKLCSVSGPVRLLFQLVRFHRVFEIFNTRDEAIKAFAAAGQAGA